MAGIGFELNRLLNKQSYLGMMQAYGLAGLLSAGPWMLAIFGILLISFLSVVNLQSMIEVRHFQVVIIYLISGSLILSSIFQLSFSRFTADQLYLKSPEKIVPNFNGAMLILFILSSLVGMIFSNLFLPDESFLVKTLVNASFMLLCVIWLTTSLLAGIKAYRVILFAFLIGYGITAMLGLAFQKLGFLGFMLSFLIGQALLLMAALVSIYFNYPSKQLIKFDFFKGKRKYFPLVLIGFFYNLGLWIDKYIFWFHSNTSEVIFGSLRASTIYDLPIFWAYLALIPGMAVFLLALETDFADYYKQYCDDVVNGKSYETIERARNSLVYYARVAIFKVINTQIVFSILIFSLSPIVFKFFKISPLYLYLLYVLVVAAGLNLIFWGLLNILDYLDRRLHVLILTFTFVILNAMLTWLSIYLGVFYYGYGLAISLLLVLIVAFFILDRDMEELEFKTFMFQHDEISEG